MAKGRTLSDAERLLAVAQQTNEAPAKAPHDAAPPVPPPIMGVAVPLGAVVPQEQKARIVAPDEGAAIPRADAAVALALAHPAVAAPDKEAASYVRAAAAILAGSSLAPQS